MTVLVHGEASPEQTAITVEEKTEVSMESIKAERSKLLPVVLGLVLLYYIVSMVMTPTNWQVRTVVCGFIILKIAFEFFPVRRITHPISRAVAPLAIKARRVPSRIKLGIGLGLLALVLLVAALGFAESNSGTMVQRAQSMLGMVVLIALMVMTSRDFGSINWQPVVTGILLQVLVGLFVMKSLFGKQLFRFLSNQCIALLGFATEGTEFVFGSLSKSSAFVFTVLPAILFFSAVIQILYYLGWMQWLIVNFAWVFKFAMDTSGCESIAAAASPFVGMAESPLLIKPFLCDMTRSELHQVMTSGLATIAGSVLISFISFGINAEALITSCVMSIPCSLALSKLRYPETEESKSKGKVIISYEKESNLLHAAANGASQGITLCLMVAGTLLAIISLLALVDALLGFFGGFVSIPNLTLQLMGGYIFIPFAWLVGVPYAECKAVGQLMAIKLFANEFVAFGRLAELQTGDGLSPRSTLLATYALCGFANFSSIGIQVGCLGAMAPTRKRDFAELAISAMLTGTMCTFISAAIAGLLI
ncbi:hypothetical protein L0F63_003090 [Massospora cicadina]|nr:hypothetical protein L0F63_003090 [Massospora cicadina]